MKFLLFEGFKDDLQIFKKCMGDLTQEETGALKSLYNNILLPSLPDVSSKLGYTAVYSRILASLIGDKANLTEIQNNPPHDIITYMGRLKRVFNVHANVMNYCRKEVTTRQSSGNPNDPTLIRYRRILQLETPNSFYKVFATDNGHLDIVDAEDFLKEYVSDISSKINNVKKFSVNDEDTLVRAKESEAGGDYKTLYIDDVMELFEVNSWEGMVELGERSPWCAAKTEDRSYYDTYRNDVRKQIYIVHFKKIGWTDDMRAKKSEKGKMHQDYLDMNNLEGYKMITFRVDKGIIDSITAWGNDTHDRGRVIDLPRLLSIKPDFLDILLKVGIIKEEYVEKYVFKKDDKIINEIKDFDKRVFQKHLNLLIDFRDKALNLFNGSITPNEFSMFRISMKAESNTPRHPNGTSYSETESATINLGGLAKVKKRYITILIDRFHTLLSDLESHMDDKEASDEQNLRKRQVWNALGAYIQMMSTDYGLSALQKSRLMKMINIPFDADIKNITKDTKYDYEEETRHHHKVLSGELKMKFFNLLRKSSEDVRIARRLNKLLQENITMETYITSFLLDGNLPLELVRNKNIIRYVVRNFIIDESAENKDEAGLYPGGLDFIERYARIARLSTKDCFTLLMKYAKIDLHNISGFYMAYEQRLSNSIEFFNKCGRPDIGKLLNQKVTNSPEYRKVLVMNALRYEEKTYPSNPLEDSSSDESLINIIDNDVFKKNFNRITDSGVPLSTVMRIIGGERYAKLIEWDYTALKELVSSAIKNISYENKTIFNIYGNMNELIEEVDEFADNAKDIPELIAFIKSKIERLDVLKNMEYNENESMVCNDVYDDISAAETKKDEVFFMLTRGYNHKKDEQKLRSDIRNVVHMVFRGQRKICDEFILILEKLITVVSKPGWEYNPDEFKRICRTTTNNTQFVLRPNTNLVDVFSYELFNVTVKRNVIANH